ncbi:unnamed protein product [Orchesella dallaii]|uniref:Uncharacterized protein n=1 Tax=Orchesella dallaii TaxID=48710 RepID=A0ABP1RS64_9HEXA
MQTLPTSTTFPTVMQPEAANPFRRSMVAVEGQSKLVAKAKFHPIIFKNIPQQLGNLRIISSACLSALEVCTDKIVKLNNGIISLQQNGGQSGKDREGGLGLDMDVGIQDNVLNIQTGFAQLRSLSILLNNSTQRIQRDGQGIRDGLVQLNNSSGKLTETAKQTMNEVSQVSAQVTQFGNRWGELMDDIRQLILVAEFLQQEAIERGQDVKNLNKSFEELKAEETHLHNQSLELNDSIRGICEELRTKLDGVESAVKDLRVDMVAKFNKLDEGNQRHEISIGELRNEVQNRAVVQMDDAMSNAEDELGLVVQPLEGQGSTVPPIQRTVNEGAVNMPDSPGFPDTAVVGSSFSTRQPRIGSSHSQTEVSIGHTQASRNSNSGHVVVAGVKPNREVENLQIGFSKVLAVSKAKKSSQRKPVTNKKSSCNGVQITRQTRSFTTTTAVSTLAKRVVDLDSSNPRPDPMPKRQTRRRLARSGLSSVFSSSSESLKSLMEIENSSDWFIGRSNRKQAKTTKKKAEKVTVQVPKSEPKQKVLRKPVTRKVSCTHQKLTKKQPAELAQNYMITRQRKQQMEDAAGSTVTSVGCKTRSNLRDASQAVITAI